ncbi:hypothetical protein HPB50_027994 [Hyalomma asiaticum]|nr:hypothetical protein HPB50_027994 [Hyalomma asiaticum]
MDDFSRHGVIVFDEMKLSEHIDVKSSGSTADVRCKCPHPVDDSRALYFFSDFVHLVKNVRNAFLSRGFNTPEGRVHADYIREAWRKDNDNVTLKVMPHINQIHLFPNAFEKMRVGPALRLFSEEVLKGLFFYRKQVQKAYVSASETEAFISKMSRLIKIMTSRTPRRALKPNSADTDFLKQFLVFLNTWEMHANDIGFLSKSTAEGLRVTLQSTLDIVQYLCSKCNFKYIMTSKLGQDKLENLFGIVRQSNGTNDHPNPTQFLLTLNALAFYNLAKPPKAGNCRPEVVSSLLDNCRTAEVPRERAIDSLDKLVDEGNINDAEATLDFLPPEDHGGYVISKSSSRLTHYIAGTRKVTAASMSDLASFLEGVELPKLGCGAHNKQLTLRVLKFYVLLRLRFFVKSLNRERSCKREQMKHLKLRRST